MRYNVNGNKKWERDKVSNKERCINIIEKIPEEQLQYIEIFLANAYNMIEEAFDDAFCLALAEQYDRLADKNDKGTPIEELAEKWGVDIDSDYEN